MLMTELPGTAVSTAPGEWSDPMSREKYFVDPHDPTLLVRRAWTPAELAAEHQQEENRSTNRDSLTAALKDSIQQLRDAIGPSDAVAGTETLNAIAADTNANIRADPSRYVKTLARTLRRTNRALIALAKIQLDQLDDTNLGG